MKQALTIKAFRIALLTVLLLGSAAAALAQVPPARSTPWPPQARYHAEHPQHRLAWWYANESTRQSEQARSMVCGFAGQRWTLDWDVHYRWALRAVARRIYQRVEERDRHLATCRSRKLREHQRPPYRRDPGDYGRG